MSHYPEKLSRKNAATQPQKNSMFAYFYSKTILYLTYIHCRKIKYLKSCRSNWWKYLSQSSRILISVWMQKYLNYVHTLLQYHVINVFIIGDDFTIFHVFFSLHLIVWIMLFRTDYWTFVPNNRKIFAQKLLQTTIPSYLINSKQ